MPRNGNSASVCSRSVGRRVGSCDIMLVCRSIEQLLLSMSYILPSVFCAKPYYRANPLENNLFFFSPSSLGPKQVPLVSVAYAACVLISLDSTPCANKQPGQQTKQYCRGSLKNAGYFFRTKYSTPSIPSVSYTHLTLPTKRIV